MLVLFAVPLLVVGLGVCAVFVEHDRIARSKKRDVEHHQPEEVSPLLKRRRLTPSSPVSSSESASDMKEKKTADSVWEII